MQLLSLGSMLGALAAPEVPPRILELLRRPEVMRALYFFAGLLVAGQLISILANWVASRAVADKDDATFGNAFKLWLLERVFAIVWTVGLVLIAVFAGPMKSDWQTAFVYGGAVLLAILVAFLIPMKIYRIGFWHALGLLALSGAISFGATIGLRFATEPIFFSPEQIAAIRGISGATPEERRRFGQRIAGKDAPDEIDRLLEDTVQPIGAPKSLADREAAVVKLQQMLEARRPTLPRGNAEAAANFQRQLAQYLRLLEAVKAERANQKRE